MRLRFLSGCHELRGFIAQVDDWKYLIAVFVVWGDEEVSDFGPKPILVSAAAKGCKEPFEDILGNSGKGLTSI